MRFIQLYIDGITRLNFWIGKWISRIILLICLLLVMEVFFRHAAGSPKVWTSELAQLLFGVYAALSGGYILARHGHVKVDIIYNAFSTRNKAILDLFTSFLFFIFIIALLYFGTSLAYDAISFWERSQSAWDPPVWPVKLAIPVGAVLMLLQGVAKVLDDARIAFSVGSSDDSNNSDKEGES